MKKVGLVMVLCIVMSGTLVYSQGWKTDESEKYLKWWDNKYKGSDTGIIGGVLYQKGEYNEAIPKLEHSIANGNNDGRICYQLGFCYEQTGNLEKAEENFLKASELLDQQNPLHKYNYYAKYHIAIIEKNKGNLDNAIQWINKAIDTSPGEPSGYNLLGWLLAEKGDINGAIRNYEYSFKIAPEQEDALYNLAVLYYMKGNKGKAKEYFQKLLKINPENKKAKAYISYLQGETSALESGLSRLILPDPSLRHCYLAQEAFKEGDLEKAREEYELAIETNPESIIGHFGLGVVYEFNREGERYGKGCNLEKSSFHYEKVLQLNPFLVNAMYNLAVIYQKEEDDFNAKRLYLRILRLNPDDTRTHYNLAVLYDNRLKNLQKAVYHYKRCLQLLQDVDKKAQIKARIKRLRRYL